MLLKNLYDFYSLTFYFAKQNSNSNVKYIMMNLKNKKNKKFGK